MQVIITENYDELSEVGADIVVEEMQRLEKPVICFATGSTPIGVYQNLISAYKEGIISFKDVISYNLDEYVGLDQSHDQSYYYFMQDNLFSKVNILKENIHFASGQADTMDENIKKYQDELAENEIDLLILGIGSNGHIAFNEPGTSFSSKTHVVKLDEKTRLDNCRFFNSIDEVPEYAITMGISEIMSAKKIIMLAEGEKKAPAIKELLEGYKTEEFPASIVLDHDDVTLIVDTKAASLLTDI